MLKQLAKTTSFKLFTHLFNLLVSHMGSVNTENKNIFLLCKFFFPLVLYRCSALLLFRCLSYDTKKLVLARLGPGGDPRTATLKGASVPEGIVGL